MGFTYFAHAYYTLLATVYTFQVATTILGTMPDEDGDNQLETGDSDTGGTWNGGPTDYGNYLGTVVMPTATGNVTMPVFESLTGAIRVLSLVNVVVNWAAQLPPILNGDVFPLCLGEGTGIATPEGETRVEDLRIGDLVLTAEGHAVPVRWIGRQTLVKFFYRDHARLVRIEAGALGNHSDLHVTGDHGMILGGYVVNAAALAGAPGIDWVPLSETPERQTVYHVETEAHDVILANGAPTESFIDYAGRRHFDNFDEYQALYGGERSIAEAPMPRISSARHLPEELRMQLGLCEAGLKRA